MKAVIQRVSSAEVTVFKDVIGKIGTGFLILLGVENTDNKKEAELLAAKISGLRIFCDENDKMNLSLQDVSGSVLVVSNFTLCGACKKGRRPFFGDAARPEKAEPLYEYFCEQMSNNDIMNVQKGEFGADMKISMVNDGPVTLILDSKELSHI